jgi:hypothetical protein
VELLITELVVGMVVVLGFPKDLKKIEVGNGTIIG